MRHVAVKVIAHYLFVFLLYLKGFEYSWHSLYLLNNNFNDLINQ